MVMVRPDYPIDSKADDVLGRVPLAQRVAELILKFKGKESYVIGIEGLWGSGKTSFINLILEELESKENVIALKFNPWNFTGQNELLKDFFESLANTLKQTSFNQGDVQIVRQYASKLVRSSEFVFAPEASFLGLKLSAGQLKKFGGEQPLQKDREELNELLKTLKKKIVIVLDDIDRLNVDETKLIFKLVKLTADFPNTVFLLAYDRSLVEQRLTEDGFDGGEYMKKIVQISFALPAPDTQDLYQLLFSDLNKSIEEVYGERELSEEERKRWTSIFHNGFGELFRTVRDIKRYISSLRLDWSIVGAKDVNMIDFITIEGIRVFSPKFYDVMAAQKVLFTELSGLFAGLNTAKDESARKEKYDELLKLVPNEHKAKIDSICKELFPVLDFRSSYTGEWVEELRKELRICSSERFDFYFRLGVPRGEVSESDIENLLETLDKKEDFAKNILRFKEEGVLRKALERITDNLENVDAERAKTMILSLWDLEREIRDEPTHVFDIEDVPTKVTRLTYQTLKRVVSDTERKSFLALLITQSKYPYYPVYFISLLESEVENKEKRSTEPLLEQETLEELKSMALSRIREAAKNGSLKDEGRNLPRLLYRWQAWGSAEEVSQYVEDLLKTKEGLLMLLVAFVQTVRSTAGNYNNLSKNAIAGLYSIEKIDELVASISDEELARLSLKEQEAINLYRNPPRDW